MGTAVVCGVVGVGGGVGVVGVVGAVGVVGVVGVSPLDRGTHEVINLMTEGLNKCVARNTRDVPDYVESLVEFYKFVCRRLTKHAAATQNSGSLGDPLEVNLCPLRQGT